MAEIAEAIVEEWLNRQGYFTIRDKRDGNRELDILAVKWEKDKPTCWHYEVQVSSKPISYIAKWPREDQRKYGVPASSARKKSPELIRKHVDGWVKKKFRAPEIHKLLESLAPGVWNEALVHGRVRHQEELDLIEKHGVKLVPFTEVLQDLSKDERKRSGAAGSELTELLRFVKFGQSQPLDISHQNK